MVPSPRWRKNTVKHKSIERKARIIAKKVLPQDTATGESTAQRLKKHLSFATSVCGGK